MSLYRILVIMKKGLRLGPQNPFLLFVFLAPFLYTLIFQLMFGPFWKPKPVIVVYERGEKAAINELKKSNAVDMKEAGSAEEVRQIVKDKRADIGIIFPEKTKELLAAKERIFLKTYINGESLAKDRAIVAAMVINALRELSPEPPPISFKQVKLGEEKALTLMEMSLPLIVLIAVLVGAYMLPASFLVQEREKKTLTAILVTPATAIEVLLAFGLLGVFLSMLTGLIVLFFNVGFTQPLLLLLPLILGSILAAEWGLALGLLAKDMNTLFANIKALNIFMIAPAVVIMFPNWPQWIAKIFPTYYIAHPIFRISIYGEGWSEIGWEILVLVGLAIVFLLPLIPLSRRLEKVF